MTIVAKHMPGDYDIEYTSPWAGADVTPFAKEGTNEARWEAETWPFLSELAKNVPEAGIHFQSKCTSSGTGEWDADVEQNREGIIGFKMLGKE